MMQFVSLGDEEKPHQSPPPEMLALLRETVQFVIVGEESSQFSPPPCPEGGTEFGALLSEIVQFVMVGFAPLL